MIKNRFKAIIFDLDGTLVDSEPGLRYALNLTLGRARRDLLNRDQVIKMIGDGVPKLVERAFLATGGPPDETLEKTIAYFSYEYSRVSANLSEIFPGTLNMLSSLKNFGLKVGICTNKPENPAHKILDALNISRHIDALVGGDTIPGIIKPDSRHLAAVLTRLETNIDQAIMVGDNHNDAFAAKELGIPFVIVKFGYAHQPIEELEADAVIDHFDELISVLDSIAINSGC